MNNLQSVKTFLSTRRSTPPALLGAPFPKREEIIAIAEMGLRVPDHKKLEPWRLVVLDKSKLAELSKIVEIHAGSYLDEPTKSAKIVELYKNAGSVIVMVYSPKSGAPEWEQHLSMGAVGVSLVNGAIAHGYGANWLSGFLCDCSEVLEFLGVEGHEELSGLIHIGTASANPPERPRPNITDKIQFL